MSSYKIVYRDLASYREHLRTAARRLQRIEAVVNRCSAANGAEQTTLAPQARSLQTSARTLAELAQWMAAAGDAAGEAAETLLLAEYRNCRQLEPAPAAPAPEQPGTQAPDSTGPENGGEPEDGSSSADSGAEQPSADNKGQEEQPAADNKNAEEGPPADNKSTEEQPFTENKDSESDSTPAADDSSAGATSPNHSVRENSESGQADDIQTDAGATPAAVPLAAAAAVPLAAGAAAPESAPTAGGGAGGSDGGAPGSSAPGAGALPTDFWDDPLEAADPDADLLDPDADLPGAESDIEPVVEPDAPVAAGEAEAAGDESAGDDAAPAVPDSGKTGLGRAAVLGTAGLGSALAAGGIALKSGKNKKSADGPTAIHPTKGVGEMTAAAGGGLDIAAQGNPEIVAAVGGMVRDAVGWRAPDFRVDPTSEGYQPGPDDYGNYVTIVDDDGRQYLYAHLSELGPNLKNGARIQAGSTLGRMGSTGNSRTDHLHLEVATSEGVPLDPAAALGLKT